MSDFIKQPPNEDDNEKEKMFSGGMMPVESDCTSIILIDVRNLKLSIEEGKELEKSIRHHVFDRLGKSNCNIEDRAIIDLCTSVFGIAFD